MNDPMDLIQHCRRRWWWSQLPFWAYLDGNGDGWANLVDTHPGMFNLTWLAAGEPAGVLPYGIRPLAAQWAFVTAPHITVGGEPLTDLAFRVNLEEFKRRAWKPKVIATLPKALKSA